MLDALFLYGLDMLHVNVFTFLETMDLIIKKYNDEILLLEFSCPIYGVFCKSSVE